MKTKILIFTYLAISLLFISEASASYLKFLVCPNEYSKQLKEQPELGNQREILFEAEYEMLAVTKNTDNKIIPIQHFRPEHTFTFKLQPESVTWENSLHVSTIVIIESPSDPVGIAIKENKENNWKVYWLKGVGDIVKSQDIGVLYLPPYNELKPLSDTEISN